MTAKIKKKFKNNNIRKKYPDGPLGHLSYEVLNFYEYLLCYQSKIYRVRRVLNSM